MRLEHSPRRSAEKPSPKGWVQAVKEFFQRRYADTVLGIPYGAYKAMREGKPARVTVTPGWGALPDYYSVFPENPSPLQCFQLLSQGLRATAKSEHLSPQNAELVIRSFLDTHPQYPIRYGEGRKPDGHTQLVFDEGIAEGLILYGAIQKEEKGQLVIEVFARPKAA